MVDISKYNCGGFALGTYDWVTPYKILSNSEAKHNHRGEYTEAERECWIYYLIDQGYTRLEIANMLLARDAQYLLSRYSSLEQVDGIIDTDTPLIAYRISVPDINNQYFAAEDIDFHFRLRIKGFWFEKVGSEGIRLCTASIEEPWVSSEDLVYDSDIIYFIQKN